MLLDLAAQLAERPEGGDQQDRQRPEVADHQPADRTGQQRPDLKPGTTVEEVGEPAAHRPPRRRRLLPAASTAVHRDLASCSALDLRPALDPLVVGLAHARRGRRRSPRPASSRIDLVEVLLVRRRGRSRSAPCPRSARTTSRSRAPRRTTRPPAALASGLMMWSIHMYMQFGCSASELIIHVSDQPVAPSSGRTTSSRARRRRSAGWLITCHVVPTDESPLANAWISFGVVGPVLADVLVLLLQQLDRGVELLLVELVRIRDPEVGLVLASGTAPRRRCRSGCRTP